MRRSFPTEGKSVKKERALAGQIQLSASQTRREQLRLDKENEKVKEINTVLAKQKLGLESDIASLKAEFDDIKWIKDIKKIRKQKEKELNEFLAHVAEEKERLQNELDTAGAEHVTALGAAKESAEKKKEKLGKAETDLIALNKKLNDTAILVTEQEEILVVKRKENSKLTQDNLDLSVKIGEARKALAQIKVDMGLARNALAALAEEKRIALEIYEKANDQASTKEKELFAIETRIAETNATILTLSSQVEDLEKLITENEKKNEKLEKKIVGMEADIMSVNTQRAKNADMVKKLTEAAKRLGMNIKLD